MKTFTPLQLRQSSVWIGSILAGLILSSCFTPPDTSPAPELKGNYILDPAHASLVWRISHVGMSNYTARFDKISGQLTFDPTNPAKSQVFIKIDPKSVSTGDPDFDKTIAMGAAYFNAEKFPDITFTATQIELTGENTGVITGNLNFRGQTNPVVLNTVFNGAGKSFGHKGKTLGFSADGTFSRSDFGLTTLKSFGIGDEISVHIEAEFNEP